jgi:hypothetical protein
MIAFIKLLLEARRERINTEWRADGFDYGAGWCLRGGNPAELRALAEAPIVTPFDRGVLSAIATYEKLTGEKS